MNNNIHRTLRKVYLLHKMYNSKHSVDVGEIYLARTSFIIQQTHHKAHSLRKMYINEHSVGVGADSSRPYIIHNTTNTPQGSFIA